MCVTHQGTLPVVGDVLSTGPLFSSIVFRKEKIN